MPHKLTAELTVHRVGKAKAAGLKARKVLSLAAPVVKNKYVVIGVVAAVAYYLGSHISISIH